MDFEKYTCDQLEEVYGSKPKRFERCDLPAEVRATKYMRKCYCYVHMPFALVGGIEPRAIDEISTEIESDF